METPQESIRRVEDPVRGLGKEATQMWPSSRSWGELQQAGRHLLYEVMVQELDPLSRFVNFSTPGALVNVRRITQQFKLFKYVLRSWFKLSDEVDDQGSYERGYYRYFIAYIPLPWTSSEDDRSGQEVMRDWMLETIEYETGLHLIPVSKSAYQKLSEDWSEPVEVKIENGEMLFRALDRDAMLSAMGLRHPQAGELIEGGPPWVKTWVSD